MATKAQRVAEAQRASVTFQDALSVLGARATAAALSAWEDVPANLSGPAAGRWLSRAIAAILPWRRRSRRLGRAYYRYVRALYTGATIQDDLGTVEDETTLGALRQDFRSAVRAATGSASTPPSPQSTPPREAPTEAPVASDEALEDDDDRVLVEELRDLEREAERIERQAEEELRIALEALGSSNLQKKIDALDDELPAREIEDKRRSAREQAGARQAAAAARVAKDGARSDIWSALEKDTRAIGYVRLSRTGTPCGFCAMLISRGPVYGSAESATTFGEGDLYHDNCNCYAEPVFSREQYDSSPLFALNRRYSEEWPRVTRGLSGKAALSAWRYYIRQQTRRAQAVRSTAQEA